MFLQSFGYAYEPVRTLRAARAMLSDDGFVLLTRTQPIRYALERAERNGTSLGEEYFSRDLYSYRSSWNDQITLSKLPYTMSDLLNVFSAAGLWIETTVEPHYPRTPDAATRTSRHGWTSTSASSSSCFARCPTTEAPRPNDPVLPRPARRSFSLIGDSRCVGTQKCPPICVSHKPLGGGCCVVIWTMGAWIERYGSLLNEREHDCGYRLIIAFP